jgi:dihydroxyacetone kinase-like predicted kinase
MTRQQTADSRQQTWRVLLLSAVCCLLSFTLFAAEPPKDSDLVAAAKKAKAGRVTIPKKTITNADVKKAKGKLIELPGKAPVANQGPPADTRGSIARHEAARKAEAAAEVVQADAEKKVADLEKELAAIEQSYYEENDPTFRDDVIRKKFDEKKREFDSARAALANK